MSIVGRMKQAQGALMAAADERMRGVKETVQAMLAVKVFGWEASFRASVKQARKTELAHSLRGCRRFARGAGANAVMEAVPILCALASLGSYGLLYPDRPLTASRAFVALLVFNQLRMPLMILPMTIQFVVAGLAAVARIDDFLGRPSLNVVVGAVASGKSTLAALLGELERTSGTVAVRARRALCPQAPWIFNATLKENVLFGAEYDAARYARSRASTARDDGRRAQGRRRRLRRDAGRLLRGGRARGHPRRERRRDGRGEREPRDRADGTGGEAPAKVDEERKDDATADAGKLTTAEDRVVGTVSMRVLGSYARLCGTFFVFLVAAFLVLKTAGAVCAQAWVAEWTDATADEADDGADDGLNLAAVNASAVASAEVHGLAFDAVVRAPLAYFEVTPPGRILARFGNDINVVDAPCS
ncbi:ABC transporter [Aureococcus anophagefferens]|uniref:ABC transporter n=1 Tax=Aureococcus anophagefferens TaxID=44056 RepID=A0ABR1FX55_AURAN